MKNKNDKLTKKIFSLLLAVIMCFSVPLCAFAATGETEYNKQYSVSDNAAAVKHYSTEGEEEHIHCFVLLPESFIPATCTKRGKAVYECSCGELKTEYFEPLGHKTETKIQPATIYQDGRIIETCTVCKKVVLQHDLPQVVSIELSENEYIYDGKMHLPDVIIKYRDGEFERYTPSCSPQSDLGEYKIPVKLTGNYDVNVTLKWTIRKKPKKITPKVVLSKRSLPYLGWKQRPDVKVYDGKKLLNEGSDYTISCNMGKNVGSYRLRVDLKGAYTGTKTVHYKIVPARPKISSVKSYKEAFKASFENTSSISGIQLRYSLKNNMSASTTLNLKSNAKSKKVIGLKSKKTYYVRIRTYKIVDGKKYYSAWSKVKSVKTK